MWKQRRIGKPGAKIIVGRLRERGPYGNRLPDRSRLKRATGPLFRRLGRNSREAIGDKRPCALARGHESFARESFVGDIHRHARHVERFRELAAWREAIARAQSALENGASNLTIDFAAKILAPDQTDVKWHPASLPQHPEIGLVK